MDDMPSGIQTDKVCMPEGIEIRNNMKYIDVVDGEPQIRENTEAYYGVI
jgi:hypothetical protein